MSSNNSSISNELKKTVDLYLRHWKIITFCIAIALALAYSYLRYSTFSYSASAVIQLKDDQESSKLQLENEITQTGLFSNGTNKVKDEIQVMTSRALISNVIENLNLNVSYYTQGKIKEKEHYKNAPIKINFFSNDSVIKQVDTTLFIKIKSPTEFLMFRDDAKSIIERDDRDGKLFSFGERIKTGYGDIVIVPNIGDNSPSVGSNLRISVKPTSKLVGKYKAKIIVGTGEGSSVLKLEIEEHIPAKAIDILNEIIKEYNKDVLNDKEEVVKVTSEFINNRLEIVFKELEETDFTAEQIQKKNNLTALGSQANIYLESEKLNEAKINNTTNTIQLIDFLSDELSQKNSSADLVPANIGLNDPSVAQITKNHNDLVAQRNRLLKNSSEKNPVVINLNNQIEALKANLQSALSNMKQTSQITLNSLNQEDARIRGQLYTAPTKQRQLRDIERQQGIKESLYLYLLEKREESAIRLGMYSPKAKIIDQAYSSYIPVSPNTMFTYLAAFLLGLAIPVGFIYVKDLLDTKLYSKDDLVQILDIPYLGDIPKAGKKEKLIKDVDYSPKAEAFRIVRSNIDFILSDVKGRAKKLFITSTKAQEGKSHTSTNLATSISFSKKSVLLVEMDIRVPKILDYLGIDEKPKKGLSDYLADSAIKPDQVVVKNTNNEFLDIIPSGTIPPNPSELLMSDRVKELFDHFEKKYDYIIADTSAVGLVSDTMLISKYADMFVYVVSADGVDKRQLVHVATPLYEEKRLPNMVLLLNGTVAGKKGYGYGYGYGNNPTKKKKGFFKFS